MDGGCRRVLLALLLCGAWLAPGRLFAQTSLTSASLALARAEAAAAQDPCTPSELQTGWIDWLQRKVSRTVCGSALWFDGLFGSTDVYDERDSTHGRIFLGVLWDERDGFDLKLRFRVKVSLPQAENRASLIIGREAVDDYISDQSDVGEGLPNTLAGEEEAWMVGLGWTPMEGRFQRLNFDVGVKVDVPIDPYARVHYRANLFVTEKALLRFRQTFFWQRSEGFGTTTRFDRERMLSDRFLVRWLALGTVSESTQGLDWQAGATLFHYLGSGRALAYLVEIFGETKREVPIEDYGLRVIYRQSAFRPWLFLELSAGLRWPRYTLEETRKINPGVGIGFEMLYGNQPG